MHVPEYDEEKHSCNDECPFFERAGYSNFGICRKLTDWKRKIPRFVEFDEGGRDATCYF